jgi:hypothetical protein
MIRINFSKLKLINQTPIKRITTMLDKPSLLGLIGMTLAILKYPEYLKAGERKGEILY